MLAGVIVLVGWVICLRLTLRSMGGLGLLLANAFFAAISWIGLVTVAAILAVGMSWSHWRGRRGPV